MATTLIGKARQLLSRPTKGQRDVERATKGQRAYTKGQLKGAGTGAAAVDLASEDSVIEDVVSTITGVPKETFVQKEARSSDNTSSKMKNTVRKKPTSVKSSFCFEQNH